MMEPGFENFCVHLNLMILRFPKGIELRRSEIYYHQFPFSSPIVFSEHQKCRRVRAKKGELVNRIPFCPYMFVQNNTMEYAITIYEVDTGKFF